MSGYHRLNTAAQSRSNVFTRACSSRCAPRFDHLSLSRLNHGLPRAQTHPEVVQGTTEFHHQITDACFPQTDAIFDDATPLDAAVDMLDPQPPLVERLVGQFLLQGRVWLTCGKFGLAQNTV
jgi:hypothetical protein